MGDYNDTVLRRLHQWGELRNKSRGAMRAEVSRIQHEVKKEAQAAEAIHQELRMQRQLTQEALQTIREQSDNSIMAMRIMQKHRAGLLSTEEVPELPAAPQAQLPPPHQEASPPITPLGSGKATEQEIAEQSCEVAVEISQLPTEAAREAAYARSAQRLEGQGYTKDTVREILGRASMYLRKETA